MWQEKNNSLHKKFEFDGFDQTVVFLNEVFKVAKETDHHPKVVNEYTTVELWLTTHSAGGEVTEKDKKFAQEIGEIIKRKFQKKHDKHTTISVLKLYTDGGSRGNPGPAAVGYVIYKSDDTVVKKYKEFIGTSTNNKAEYQALIKGLQNCIQLGARDVEVLMDSELIINQLKGKYRVKNVDLKPLYEKVKNLQSQFENFRCSHVPRNQNKVADRLVNEALDEL